jgi:hypothetical protein
LGGKKTGLKTKKWMGKGNKWFEKLWPEIEVS